MLNPTPLNIPDDALVVDVGGSWNPHPRADYVIDIQAYDDVKSRYGNLENVGRFNRSTWIQADLCSSEPLPIADDFFDYAICSHLLEDVRDPLRVCEHLSRIAKAGYIETPTLESEITRGVEHADYSGRWHHRWVVEVIEGELCFRLKPAFVNSVWYTRLPRSWWTDKEPGLDFLAHTWEGQIKAREVMGHYHDHLQFFSQRVRELHAYPEAYYQAWNIGSRLKGVARQWSEKFGL